MNNNLCCVLFLFASASWLIQVEGSSPADSFYTAGVVEFQPAKYQGSTLEQLNNNLNKYIEIINSDEAASTDIIVFPELTLNNAQHLTYIPEPKNKIIPCNNQNYDAFLRDLSCAAKYSRKYIVVNLLEKENCSPDSQAVKNDPRPCAKNGLNQFNTNVVFNRDGMLIARYRKFNSYDMTTNVTYLPELSTFDTDFGVTFGMFICFDINFYAPAKELVEMGVKDFVFSSFWFSELPFLTGVQLQQSWAYANNVNLLAAGASSPSGGTTGSGIYSGKQGALVSVMANTPERKLYIANVPKSSHWKTSVPSVQKIVQHKPTGGIHLMREYRMDDFTSKLIDPKDDSLTVEQNLCHESFCCQFNLTLNKKSPPEKTSSYKYHMAVFDGDRKYSGFGYTKYKICAVYACTDEPSYSCGRVFDEKIDVRPELVFEKISIEGNFPNTDSVLIMPNSLDQNLLPLTTDSFEFNIENKKKIQHVQYKLTSELEDLLTFGIYANYYNGGMKQRNSSLSSLLSKICLALFVIQSLALFFPK